jgi:hypothetical protein
MARTKSLNRPSDQLRAISIQNFAEQRPVIPTPPTVDTSIVAARAANSLT